MGDKGVCRFCGKEIYLPSESDIWKHSLTSSALCYPYSWASPELP